MNPSVYGATSPCQYCDGVVEDVMIDRGEHGVQIIARQMVVHAFPCLGFDREAYVIGTAFYRAHDGSIMRLTRHTV